MRCSDQECVYFVEFTVDPNQPSTPLERGMYAPRQPTDIRSPCPAINSLANRGYIHRDGRNVLAGDLRSTLNEFGIGSLLASSLTYPIFNEIQAQEQQLQVGSRYCATLLRMRSDLLPCATQSRWTQRVLHA